MSGIDTTKYHTWPRKPYGNVTKRKKTSRLKMRQHHSCADPETFVRELNFNGFFLWVGGMIQNTIIIGTLLNAGLVALWFLEDPDQFC